LEEPAEIARRRDDGLLGALADLAHNPGALVGQALGNPQLQGNLLEDAAGQAFGEALAGNLPQCAQLPAHQLVNLSIA
jgi:hypothetical protein